MNKTKLQFVNILTQLALPAMTIATQTAYATKHPEWGLILNLVAQPFWLYSGYKSWKEAGQLGYFVTTILTTLIIGAGVLNYWLFK